MIDTFIQNLIQITPSDDLLFISAFIIVMLFYNLVLQLFKIPFKWK